LFASSTVRGAVKKKNCDYYDSILIELNLIVIMVSFFNGWQKVDLGEIFQHKIIIKMK